MTEIGSCRTNHLGDIVHLHRGWYRQGFVYKNWDAYRTKSQDPCYVPERLDLPYRYDDFMALCHEQREFADQLFEAVDWQLPETVLDENLVNEEWVLCPRCGRLVDYQEGFGETVCPHCGTDLSNRAE